MGEQARTGLEGGGGPPLSDRWIEHLIAQAQAAGELDDLPGKGKPIPDLDQELDEDWWVRRWLQREQVELVTPAMALRRDVESLEERLAAEPDDAAARTLVEALNDRIRAANRYAMDGPPSAFMPRDVEAALARRAERRLALEQATSPPAPPPRPTDPVPSPRSPWWRRRSGRTVPGA